MLKVLIVGGYGAFGGRLVQLLEGAANLNLVVAGRSIAKAAAFCASRTGGQALLTPCAFDRDGDLEAQLAGIAPDLIVDASGPFQAYGAAPYRLVEAAIAARISYLDLADGADFVAGIAAYDLGAKAAGIFVLSGVSTFPVLTAAATRRLAKGLVRVEAIQGGVAPSPYAGVGLSVVEAVASYAGKPISVRRSGAARTGHAATETLRYVIAPPGQIPLRPILFSLVDVPDLTVLPRLWPEVETIWMGAGPVPESLHRAFIALAWAVRFRLLPSLSPLAPLLHWAMNAVRWGEHRGGLFVEVTGLTFDGATVKRAWHMLAEGDDGPLIPSMAAAAIIRLVVESGSPSPGARPCIAELELEDYEALFKGLQINCGVRASPGPHDGLYRRALREVYDALPEPLRDLHDAGDGAVFAGRAQVERGGSVLARAIAAVIGFPAAGEDVAVEVRFAVKSGVETWTRSFNGKRFSSTQAEGKGREAHLIVERFGFLSFALALIWRDEKLQLILRRWRVFGVVLPLWLGPKIRSAESEQGGQFSFDVEIGHPLTGRIVRYRGVLERVGF